MIGRFQKKIITELRNMNTKRFTVSDYFKQVSVIHYALLMGVLFFIALSVFLTASDYISPVEEDIQTLVLVGCSALFLGGMVIVFAITQRKLKELKSNVFGLLSKLTHYRAILILRGALCELIAFAITLVYLLTAIHFVLIIAVLSFAVLFFVSPTKERLIRELQLDSKEIEVIYNPDAEL